MKKVFFSVLLLSSFVAHAEGVRQAQAVPVNRVDVAIVGQGFPLTEVTVQATFGNACSVPTADELVAIVNYSKNFDTLNISLGNESSRMCPAVYEPVTVPIVVGQFSRPNDGTFSRVTVNQVAAK